MRNLLQLTIIVISLILFACDGKLKRQIESYQGDGQIEYLEAPGPLGASGVRIKFPTFDLSQSHKRKYNISGIPLGDAYIVGLVVPPPHHKSFISGILSYKILKDGKEICEAQENLDKYSQERGFEKRMYYYYTDGTGPLYLRIDSPSSAYLFIAEFKASEPPKMTKLLSTDLPKKVPAYLVIKRGGSK